MTEFTKEQLENKVAELENEIRLLKEDLIHDSLTGLKTRKFFNEEAKKYYDAALYVAQGVRREWFGIKHVSFIFFDIDHFKRVNDEHGHKTGDAVLKSVANEIKNGVRKSDIAARWGGEEIVVALIGASESAAVKIAESIRKNIETSAYNSLPGVHVTISAGISTSEIGLPFEDVIDRADRALYVAKESGRNQVVSYSEIEKYQNGAV